MEDEVEGLGTLRQTQLGRRRVLGRLEDLGTKLDVARLVDAVHVAAHVQRRIRSEEHTSEL